MYEGGGGPGSCSNLGLGVRGDRLEALFLRVLSGSSGEWSRVGDRTDLGVSGAKYWVSVCFRVNSSFCL